MQTIKTTYLGLELKSPVIASSCGLTAHVEQVEKWNKAGVGAVVLKSLFEEQIIGESASLSSSSDYTEANDYISAYVRSNAITSYLKLIQDSKAVCDCPIIASICCTKNGDWVKFAKDIEAAGADALELNIFFIPFSADQTSESIENMYLDIASSVVSALKIPVAVKLPKNFTNPLNVVNNLYFRGVKGVVLFNRFYEPDIDVDTLEIGTSEVLSSVSEMRGLIRWVGSVSGECSKVDVAASTGIESGEAVIKMMLAGAKVVEVSSALYKGGESVVRYMNEYISNYMDRHEYTSTDEFIGKLSKKNSNDVSAYERAQFMKYFSGYNK